MNKTLRILLSLPRTIILNLRLFPFHQAVRLPMFVSFDTDVDIKGRVVLSPDANVRPAMIRFGFLCALACDTRCTTRLHVQKEGTLMFMGEAHIGHGTRMIVRKGAEMIVGANFAVSSNTAIQCYKRIVFGRDIQFSWDCLVMDSDTHRIMDEAGDIMNEDAEINIGDKVWVGSRSTILKGVDIPSNTVIGACSLMVSGKPLSDSTVIAGQPAKSIRPISGWTL